MCTKVKRDLVHCSIFKEQKVKKQFKGPIRQVRLRTLEKKIYTYMY